MKILQNIYFIAMLLAAAIVYVCQRLGAPLPMLVQNYCNDVLAIPLTCFVVLAILVQWKTTSFKLSIAMILAIVLYFSFYFEYYLPQFNPRYTADLVDVGCYFLGGIVFYVIQRYVLKRHS